MELEKLYVSLALNAADYGQGLRNATSDGVNWARDWGNRVSSALSAAFKVGMVAVTVVLAGLMAALTSSTALAADFQTQITSLGIAASGANVPLEQLHDAALAVGSDTALVGVSATGAADAMTGLYKAGLSTNEIFGDLQGYLAGTAELGGALRAAIDLAAASELDMVQASELAAITLATFGGHLETEAERAEFVNEAMNNMVQAADASVASVSGLADALTNIGPTAAAFGFSLQETNTALAILSTRGIQGSEAGTALKSMMTNLMRPTDEVQQALSELNVELFNSDGTMRQLPEIIGQLENALMGVNEVTVIAGGRTEEQNHQLELAQRAYDQATDAIYKHQTGIKVLTDTQLQRYVDQQTNANAVITELGSITGEATTQLQQLTEAQRLEYIQTLAGTYGMNAMNALLGEGVEGWDEMTAAIGDAATIQEQAAAQAATFQGQMEALKGTIETVKIGIGEALLPVFTQLSTAAADWINDNGPAIVETFQEIVDFVTGQLVPGIQGLVNAFSFGASFDGLMGGLDVLFGAFESGDGPIAKFLEQLGFAESTALAVGRAVDRAYTSIKSFIAQVKAFIEPIAAAVAEFVTWQDVLVAVGIVLGGFVLSALASLASLVAPFLVLIGIVALLRTAWEENWGGIQEKVGAVVDWFTNTAVPNLLLFSDWLTTIAIPAVAEFGTNVQAWFVDTVIPAFVSLSAWFDEHSQTILAVLAAIGVVLAAIAASAIVTWIGGLIAAFTAFGGVSQLIMMGFWALYAAVGAVGGVLATILSPIGLVVAAVALLAAAWVADFGGIRDFFAEVWLSIQQVWDAFKLLFQGDFEGFTAGLQTAWETAWNAITTFLGNLWAMAQPHLVALWNGFVNWVTTTDWKKIGTDIVTFVTNALSTFVAKAGFQLALWYLQFVLWLKNTDWKQIGFDVVTFVLEGLYDFVKKIGTTLAGWYEAFITWKDSKDWGEIAQTAVDRVIEGLEEFINDAPDALAKWWGSFEQWFSETDWGSLAQKVIDGFIAGILAGVGAVAEAVGSLADGAAEAWDDFWDSHSPSRRAHNQAGDVTTGYADGLREGVPVLSDLGKEMGMAIVEAMQTSGLKGIEDAVAEAIADAAETGEILTAEMIEGIRERVRLANLDDLLGVGGSLGSFGRAVADRFTTEVLDPIQAQMEGLDADIADIASQREIAMRQIATLAGVDVGQVNALMPQIHLRAVMENNRPLLAVIQGLNNLNAESADLEQQRAEAAAEYAAQQERILELQRQQADLAFLQQQLDLLQTIRDAGLNPADVLEGITLGLDASLPDLIEAMSGAMAAIIAAAEDELQIASPSGVFRDIFRQVGAGGEIGLEESTDMLARAARRMSAATYEPFAGAGVGGSSSSYDQRKYETMIQLPPGADPARAVRASRHLDKLRSS